MLVQKLKEKIIRQIENVNYVTAYNLAAAEYNKRAFSDIKNCNFGKAVAVCGTGPTFKIYKQMNDVLHVSLNSAFVNDNIKFDWEIVADWGSFKNYEDKLEKYDCLKFYAHQVPFEILEIPESYVLNSKARRFYTDSYLVVDGWQSRFNCDIDVLPVGNFPNIAFTAMQIVLFSHPKTIYLVGCDASSAGHFNDFHKNKEKLKKNIYVESDKVFDLWRKLKDFASTYYPDTEIISINPVGLKGIFKDQYTDNYADFMKNGQ